jgi:uncharacterized damage-inducible protein DinB
MRTEDHFRFPLHSPSSGVIVNYNTSSAKEKNMRSITRALRIFLICLLAPTGVTLAQETPPAAPAPTANPLSSYNKGVWVGLKAILLRSAEKMPEEKYGFKPTDTVRSYGQIIGHVADAQYTFCSRVLDEKRPELKVEETKTSKGDLVAALKDALAYCDKAFDGMTDASGTQMVKLFGRDAPKLGVLTVHLVHSTEHYGNLVTYLRMNNLVPPTSEEGFRPQAPPQK